MTTREFIPTVKVRYCPACGCQLADTAAPNAKYCTTVECRRARWVVAFHKSEARRAAGIKSIREPQEPEAREMCTLCRQRPADCRCKCAGCGGPVWRWVDKYGGYYSHHACWRRNA